jgi:hypothetical protein
MQCVPIAGDGFRTEMLAVGCGQRIGRMDDANAAASVRRHQVILKRMSGV